MEQERAVYRRLPKPWLVIRLGAPLETALLRDRARCKPGGPDPLAVERRWKLESNAKYDGSIVCPINTEGDVEDCLRAAVACVWRAV
jgi:hypothetical protein